MKIRTGFVSNSSSSSFIIRGMKLSTDEIINTLNISNEELDEVGTDEYELMNFLGSKFPKGFEVESTGNYFGGQDYSTIVVGKSLGELQDGEVRELRDRTPEEDNEILSQLVALGFKDKDLKTYIQMVSNDNY